MNAGKQATEFSHHLQDNIELIQSFMGNSSDFIIREIKTACNQRTAIFYLDGMVDKQALQDNVISSLLKQTSSNHVTLNVLRESVFEVGEVFFCATVEEALDEVLSGGVLILLDGESGSLLVSLPGWEERSITESKTQNVVKGPQESFNETLRTNTTLVRRRVKDTRVRLVSVKVGRLTKTDVAIMYLNGLADQELVQHLTKRLSMITEDRVLEGEYLEVLLLEKKQQTIFPLFYNSDRPDSIAAGILEGKIALFVDGTPFVLLAPSLFVDFIQSAEDYYQSYFYSNTLRLLRYIALVICMLAPSVYIAITTFHQDMIPTQLLLSLAAQREGVPFPAFMEAMLMEATFEILREAGIRMPRMIGQAVSIVGTIVIGQAAVEATIVSAAMVIIVSLTAIASFVIPSYAMSIPFRMLRFVFMALAATFGVFGLTIGIIVLVVHLCKLNSFGVPYMSPIAPYNHNQQSDAILRFPFWGIQKQITKRSPEKLAKQPKLVVFF